MGKLSAAVGENGVLTVYGGPVRVRCFGWVDVDQDEALVLEGPARQSGSERGHRFEGVAELDNVRVVGVEHFGSWTALLLPHGSRLLVAAQLSTPEQRRATQQVRGALAPRSDRQLAADSPSKETARKVVGVVLALVLLDIFSR
ncbi:MAG: hypothetical protein RLZZ387_5557 [Chloroflexota bacterium]|jgi:hypothetical protein